MYRPTTAGQTTGSKRIGIPRNIMFEIKKQSKQVFCGVRGV